MNDMTGHNRPPPETIEDVVLAARQARDLRDLATKGIKNAEQPWLKKAEEASKPFRIEHEEHAKHYANLSTKVARWQEQMRDTNPFADPKDVSRVIIDGEVAATSRETETFEIVDPKAVPHEFCSPSEAKIKAELAMGREVPGVKRVKKYSVMIR